MSELQMGAIESRFAEMIWSSEPVSGAELVKRAEAAFGWKRTTTYTVLKRLCEKGIFQNDGGTVKRNAVTTAIHCNGGDDNPDKIDSKRIGAFRGNDIYNTFNTYGLEWTEDEYIFYINGVETARSAFSKGVSTAFEEVIVSLEIPVTVSHGKDFTTSMLVDYVKIWQKP